MFIFLCVSTKNALAGLEGCARLFVTEMFFFFSVRRSLKRVLEKFSTYGEDSKKIK